MVGAVGLAGCSRWRNDHDHHDPFPVSTSRWKTYVYERTAISVPANWKVVTDYACPEAKARTRCSSGRRSSLAICVRRNPSSWTQ